MSKNHEVLADNFFIFIAVRMKSKRLPKKALIDIEGTSLLNHLVTRLLAVFSLDQIVICTSKAEDDDELETFAKSINVRCFRGSELDVMGRFIEAASLFNATTIARVTGDNPITDAQTLSLMYQCHTRESSEYTFTHDLPVGTRSEIINVNALRRIHPQLKDPDASEYMTFMLQDERKVKHLKYNVEKLELVRPNLCFTVDTQDQLDRMVRLCKSFNGTFPGLTNIIEWVDAQTEMEFDFEYLSPSIELLERCGYVDG